MKMICLSDFEGAWGLSKTINNANGPDGTFKGEAHWSPSDAAPAFVGDIGLTVGTITELNYLEQGSLRLGSSTMRAERRYRWREPLAVYFEDGRFFHNVPPDGGDTEHLCPPDLYHVHYDFADWPNGFRAIWMVRGPHKAYQMTCLYTR